MALELPPEAIRALLRWGDRALPRLSGLRALERGQLHVTLCFLGWQPPGAADGVRAVCQTAAGSGGLGLALEGAVWLPRRRPRVVAVRLDDPERTLTRLQGSLSGRLAEGGWYVPERRPYLPHVTVARVGRGARISPVTLPEPPPLRFTAECLTVFRSHLRSTGAGYEPLGTVSLLSAA